MQNGQFFAAAPNAVVSLHRITFWCRRRTAASVCFNSYAQRARYIAKGSGLFAQIRKSLNLNVYPYCSLNKQSIETCMYRRFRGGKPCLSTKLSTVTVYSWKYFLKIRHLGLFTYQSDFSYKTAAAQNMFSHGNFNLTFLTQSTY
jgi:hypothetical protein